MDKFTAFDLFKKQRNMKTNKYFLLFAICVLHVGLTAQSSNSYGQLESRFTKKKLTSSDSTAFKEAGILKAKSLFEYGDVYISNSTNMSNQAYVIDRVPDLFHVAKGDTLNTDSVMLFVNTIIANEKPNAIDIVFTEKDGVLGHVATDTENLNFEADIVLIKEPKEFGNSKEKVWQVFLSKPFFW